MLLSACMLTLDEADHIRVSVPPLLEFVDELVVIDGGSVDGTPDILQSFGEKVRVEIIPQEGAAYTEGWRQEFRRQRLQDLCRGEWIFQIDADEVVGDEFVSVAETLRKADPEIKCFGVWRMDYAPDLYHGFLPYTAHPIIPRIWRKGSVDWQTGKALHMLPYLSGTTQVISTFPRPTFTPTDLAIHHIHRAFWIGKSKHKSRTDDRRAVPMSRSSQMGNYKFAIDRIPDALVPKSLKEVRLTQKQELARRLGVSDAYDGYQPEAPVCDAQGFFLPSNADMLERLIRTLPNPILFVEVGSWLGSSTRFLAGKVGGCVVAIDHWGGSEEHQRKAEFSNLPPKLFDQFLTNCWHYRERILPVRMASQQALALPIEGIDLLYLDGAHDYESVTFDLENWSPRVAAHGLLCGDDWLWGGDKPVQRAVKDFAARVGRAVHSHGNFWWFDPIQK